MAQAGGEPADEPTDWIHVSRNLTARIGLAQLRARVGRSVESARSHASNDPAPNDMIKRYVRS